MKKCLRALESSVPTGYNRGDMVSDTDKFGSSMVDVMGSCHVKGTLRQERSTRSANDSTKMKNDQLNTEMIVKDGEH